jgi:hypothetical protein
MAAFPLEQLIVRSRGQAQALPREGIAEGLIHHCLAFLFGVLAGGALLGGLGQILLQRDWYLLQGASARMAASQDAVRHANEVLRQAESTRAVEKWAAAQGFIEPVFVAPSRQSDSSPLEESALALAIRP